MPALLHPTKNISRFPQCEESMPPFRQLASARWELTSVQRFWDPSWNPRVNCVNIHVHTQRCRHMALSWPCRFPSLTSVCCYHSLYFFTCYCIIHRELFKKWDLIFSSLQYPSTLYLELSFVTVVHSHWVMNKWWPECAPWCLDFCLRLFGIPKHFSFCT